QLEIRASYLEHLLGYLDTSRLEPLKVVVNAGNGGAGLIVDAPAPHLPIEFIKVKHEPDGNFPPGGPDPRLAGNPAATPAAGGARAARIAGSPGTATTTAASSSMRAGSSSRATTWWDFSPSAFSSRSPARASCTTRASPGTRSTSYAARAARPCCASRDTPSS